MTSGGLIPWVLFGGGFLAFLYSVAVAVGEAGDPAYTDNDRWQRTAIIASPVLFNLAVFFAAVARRWITTDLMAVVAIGCCWLGFGILRWDLPNLFR